jgi:uncharacterized protein YggE
MTTRHALAFLVLLLAGPAVATAAAQEPAASPATVTSLGQATIRQPPDRVVITFETEVRGQSPQEAQARGTAAMASVQRALEALKLPGGQVMTSGLRLSEDYDFSNNQRVRRGYLDRHTVAVRLDDVSRAGEVMTVAIGAGATGIGSLQFDRSDREELEEQALKIAVGVARARADALAAGAGRTVDRILRITEERAARVDASALGPVDVVLVDNIAVQVAAGEIEIRMRVLLTATLK